MFGYFGGQSSRNCVSVIEVFGPLSRLEDLFPNSGSIVFLVFWQGALPTVLSLPCACLVLLLFWNPGPSSALDRSQ